MPMHKEVVNDGASRAGYAYQAIPIVKPGVLRCVSITEKTINYELWLLRKGRSRGRNSGILTRFVGSGMRGVEDPKITAKTTAHG
jgi:hypothetical protein